MHNGNAISRLAFLRSIIILSLFGMPGLLQFDQTGLTQNFGLFNLQSFSRMVLYFFIGAIVLLYTAGLEKFRFNKNNFNLVKLPLFYYGVALLISVPVLSGNDIVLSSYFVMEWVIFFILFYLYIKEKGSYALTDMIDDFILLIWLKVITLLIILPIFPSLGVDIDHLHGIIRIGGYFVGPNVLSVLVAMLASYYYFYFEGSKSKKYGFFFFAIILLLGTNSRGALLSFILAFSLSLIWSRKGLNHLIFFYFGACVVAFFITYFDYFLRGMGLSNIFTLSERIPLWGKYYMEFGQSPIIGFGFIAGVKKLGLIIGKIHWVAQHAHNDFIQAIMSGGIVMAVLTFGIYFSFYRNCFSGKLKGKTKLLMRNWFIQLMAYAMLTPLINWKLFSISGIFWIFYITLKNEIHNADSIRS